MAAAASFHLIHPKFKLGKRMPKLDNRNLKFATYVKVEELPDEPQIRYWGKYTPSWPMYGNDVLGDCVPAAAGHAEQNWSHAAGCPFDPSRGDVVKAYEQAGGYNPADPNTDQGMFLLDMLNYWRKTGMAGRKITGFMQMSLPQANAAPAPGSAASAAVWKELRQVVNLFGLAYVGVQLPLLAQAQIGGIFTVPASGPTGNASPGSWGGHCVIIVDYNAFGPVCVTWGALQQMSWNWLFYYMDEAYAVLSPNWIEKAKQVAPSGFNYKQLESDISLVTAKAA